MKCQKCGHENDDAEKFCGNCGSKLEPTQAKDDKGIIENAKDKIEETKKEIKKTTKKVKATGKKALSKAKIIGITIFVILALVGGFTIYKNIFPSRDDGGSGVLNKNSNMSETIIQEQLLDIGELASAEYNFTDAVALKNSKKIKSWNIPFTTKKFTIKYEGIVKAGYEIDKIGIELDESKKEVRVILPDIKIFDCYIDSKEVVDEEDTIFNQTKMNDSVDIDNYLKCSLKLHALKKDVLKKADENAVNLIYDTLKQVVNKDWEIQFYDSTHTVDEIKKDLLDDAKKEHKEYKKLFNE